MRWLRLLLLDKLLCKYLTTTQGLHSDQTTRHRWRRKNQTRKFFVVFTEICFWDIFEQKIWPELLRKNRDHEASPWDHYNICTISVSSQKCMVIGLQLQWSILGCKNWVVIMEISNETEWFGMKATSFWWQMMEYEWTCSLKDVEQEGFPWLSSRSSDLFHTHPDLLEGNAYLSIQQSCLPCLKGVH